MEIGAITIKMGVFAHEIRRAREAVAHWTQVRKTSGDSCSFVVVEVESSSGGPGVDKEKIRLCGQSRVVGCAVLFPSCTCRGGADRERLWKRRSLRVIGTSYRRRKRRSLHRGR
jgi:hypothetical protein